MSDAWTTKNKYFRLTGEDPRKVFQHRDRDRCCRFIDKHIKIGPTITHLQLIKIQQEIFHLIS